MYKDYEGNCTLTPVSSHLLFLVPGSDPGYSTACAPAMVIKAPEV